MSGEKDDAEDGQESRFFSYQGSKVPLFIVVFWLTFFVWGIVYMLKWVPQSWMEWFQR